MKSLLYAPRVKGDLDLGLEPSRIDGAGNRQWAEILAPGGRLPGRPEQGILEATVDENPNYQIGTRRVVGDSVFRYCFTYEIQEPMKGAFNGALVDTHAFFRGNSTIAAHPAAAEIVTLDCADAVPVNHLTGGYLCRYAAPAFRCRIASNAVGTGAVVVITLADPLPVLIALNDRIHAYPSPYRQLARWGNKAATGVVGDTFTAERSVVCVPWIGIDANRWFWGQTWGFAIAGCGNQANLVGQTNNKRKVHFDGLGWAWYTVITASLPGQQEAGYLLFDGNDAYAPNGDEAYMLTLAP